MNCFEAFISRFPAVKPDSAAHYLLELYWHPCSRDPEWMSLAEWLCDYTTRLIAVTDALARAPTPYAAEIAEDQLTDLQYHHHATQEDLFERMRLLGIAPR